ncbi:MAG: alanyl-tRNA editing protein [Candidatus Hodarchaeales archaeon]
MTQKLYLDDQYLKETEVKILRINSEKSAILLDRTLFYPGGGGQPADKGTINCVKLTGIIKQGNDILHEVDHEELGEFSSNNVVRLSLDWDFRSNVMRLHTGQHLLAAVMLEKHGVRIAGNFIYPGKSHVDFEMEKNLDKEEVLEVQVEVNKLIAAGLIVKVLEMSIEQARDYLNPNRVRIDLLPKRISSVRVISIGKMDATACGGTHVSNTSQIGHLVIDRFKSKGKRRKRFYYHVEMNEQL